MTQFNLYNQEDRTRLQRFLVQAFKESIMREGNLERLQAMVKQKSQELQVARDELEHGKEQNQKRRDHLNREKELEQDNLRRDQES